MAIHKKRIGLLEVQIVLAVGLCMLVAIWFPKFQVMTASISVLLCMQDNVKFSWRMGVNRLIITFIGGLAGICVVLLDNMIASQWVIIPLVMTGLLLTFYGCKLAEVPDMSVRIGGVNFILVALTFVGTQRISYAFYRFVSTLGGVVVVLAVATVFSLFAGKPQEQTQ